MNTKRFSIIIPVYNVAPYLRECLDSVLAQTFTDWEAICVDDESVDESGKICDEYAKRDSRFRVVHKHNGGSGAARNSGIDAATGEWVLFLDGDDILEPNSLQAINGIIKHNTDVRLLRFRYYQFSHGDFGAWPTGAGHASCIEISHEINMEDFFVYMWEFAYRRDVIGTVRFPTWKRGEDRVFINRIQLFNADWFIDVDVYVYGYRVRPGSSVHSIPSAKVIADEMGHRVEIIDCIERSTKHVPYAGSGWLEGYFTDRVGQLIATKTSQERKMLWREWYNCVRDMRSAAGLSRRTRLIYRIACRVPFPFAWWLLARAYPWYRAHGILPRAWRKLKRAFH